MKKTVIIDTGKPGPIVGISAGIHGDEHFGVHVLQDFLSRWKQGLFELVCGKVCLILEGNERALSYNKRAMRPGNKYDLNRLIDPVGIPKKDREVSYEQKRGIEIQSLIDATTPQSWLDLHSFSAPTGIPYAFASPRGFQAIGSRLGIQNIAIDSSDADSKSQSWVGVANYVNSIGGSGFTFEAGFHRDPNCLIATYQSVINFLVAHNMIDGKRVVFERSQLVFESHSAVVPIGGSMPLCVSIEYQHTFTGKIDARTGNMLGGFKYDGSAPESFQSYKSGEIIGYDMYPEGQKRVVRAPYDGHVILPKDPRICSPGNEVFFFGKKQTNS